MGCLGGLLLGALCSLAACDEKTPDAGPSGPEAPAIQLATLDHRRFYLREQRGKPVVLLFWDTSCQICKREMVALEALRRELGPKRVVMASVLHDPENVDVARQMVAGLSLGYPTLLDRGGQVTASYGVKGFPTTVVVTPEGRLSFRREGYSEPLIGQLRSGLERLLDRPAGSGPER